jgi:hypothetical protein
LLIALPFVSAALRWSLPHRPCIGGFPLVIAAPPLYRRLSAVNGYYVGVSGLVVLVIGGVLVFGVYPTYFSAFDLGSR